MAIISPSREDSKHHVQLSPHQESSPPKDDDHHLDTETRAEGTNPFQKFGKTICLVFVWIMMVGFLTSTPEKHLNIRQLAVPISGAKIYDFPIKPTGSRINATFTGAFLPSPAQVEFNPKSYRKLRPVEAKENYLRIYLRMDNESIITPPTIYGVHPPHLFDLVNMTKIPVMFDITEDLEEIREKDIKLQLIIESNFTMTAQERKQEMPIMLSYDIGPINRQIGVIFAAFVLIFLYALIIWEVRTGQHL